MPKNTSLTGWLLQKIAPRAKEQTPADLVQEHLNTIRNAAGAELSGILAAALFAKKTLDTTRQVDEPFPDKYVSGETPIDAAAQTELKAYAAALQEFKVVLVERDSPQSIAVARGVTTWVATLYAMADPVLLPKAGEMWVKLVQGTEGVEEGFRFLLRREPTDVERTYLSFRPTLLTD
jgi:hypothetical protein